MPITEPSQRLVLHTLEVWVAIEYRYGLLACDLHNLAIGG